MASQNPRRASILIALAVVVSASALVELNRASAGAESLTRFCSEPPLSMEENPSGFKVRLGISRTSITPGGDLRIRVENVGTESVTYGFAYRLERRRGGSWANLPVGPFYASRLSTPPGRAGECQQVKLKRKATPGLYRVTKEVWPAEGGRSDAKLVRVKFEVRAAAKESRAARRASFCGSTMARDLEAPLRAFPAGEPVPQTLPFAPPGVEASVGPRGGGQAPRLVTQGTAVRLELESDQPVELDWRVELSVSRPRADGSRGEPVTESQSSISSVSSQSVAVTGAALSPGTYRIDLAFFDRDGNLLGSYLEYVQVVAPAFDARLAVSRTSVASGESFKVRIENLGTVPLGYGDLYTLERFQGGRWRQAPQVGHFFMPLHGLPPGEAGRCQTVPIFRAAEPGRYRIRKDVQVDSGTGTREKTLVKSFRVRSS